MDESGCETHFESGRVRKRKMRHLECISIARGLMSDLGGWCIGRKMREEERKRTNLALKDLAIELNCFPPEI